jgi:hypothetical protein
MRRPRTSTIVLGTVGSAFVILIVTMVIGSLRRPDEPTYAPSPARPRDVGDGPAGPTTYTVDARESDVWVRFDFSRGSIVVADPTSLDWDIAFSRYRIMTNGGGTNPAGGAGVVELDPAPLDSTIELPEDGYVSDERSGDESQNPVLEDWYSYRWMAHLLEPRDRLYGIRTADGRYAVLRILSYYCTGGVSGCVTFRYRYRGDGERSFPAVTAGTDE